VTSIDSWLLAHIGGLDACWAVASCHDAVYSISDRSKSGALSADTFCQVDVSSISASDANDRIIYLSQTKELYYDADGSGEIEVIKFAQLGLTSITYTDFAVI
jgi:hypothetical protein